MTDATNPGLAITCQQLVELITAYLEDDLDEATRTELEAHLSLCPGCETYLDQMRTTISELGHVPVESLSEQAQSDLLSAFRTFTAGTPGAG